MVYCPYSRVHFGMGRIPSLIGSSPRSVSNRKSSGIPPRRSNVHAYTAVCVMVQSIATDASNLWSTARGISTSWTGSMESYCYCTFDSTISIYNRTYVTVQYRPLIAILVFAFVVAQREWILRVRLYWNESEIKSNIATKWVHKESNVMFTLRGDKDQQKIRFRVRSV